MGGNTLIVPWFTDGRTDCEHDWKEQHFVDFWEGVVKRRQCQGCGKVEDL